jgi:ribonuclease HII
MPNLLYEIEHGRNDGVMIAGTDEAGRGPLAGPVIAAAVIIPQHFPEQLANAINDSKQLSEKKREALFPQLIEHCIYGIAECSANEIDQINILQASLLAMKRAVGLLTTQPHVVLVDGNKSPTIPRMKNIPIVKGDSKSLSIAAASILAKVTRDRLMQKLHAEFPHYGWDHNAGYPTAEHVAALTAHGITPHHRISFGPVRNLAGV